MQEHKRIIFNGDGYSQAWVEEARRRGLLDLPTTVDCLPRYLDQKNIQLFVSHKIYTEAEMEARYETIMEEYVKTLNIEGLTLSSMLRQDILPAVGAYTGELARNISAKRAVSPQIPCAAQTALLARLSALEDKLFAQAEDLDQAMADPRVKSANVLTAATYCKEELIPRMEAIRQASDQAELDMPSARWPYPTYATVERCVAHVPGVSGMTAAKGPAPRQALFSILHVGTGRGLRGSPPRAAKAAFSPGGGGQLPRLLQLGQAGQKREPPGSPFFKTHCPVLPKPPSPRAVAESSSTSSSWGRQMGTITSWATRSPGDTV